VEDMNNNKLTPLQEKELSRYPVRSHLRMGGWMLAGNRHAAAALYRMGLLERFENTEQVRGERRATWFEYRRKMTQ